MAAEEEFFMVEPSKYSTNKEKDQKNIQNISNNNYLVTSSDAHCKKGVDVERFKTILENIPSAVIVIEKPKGEITYANHRTIELHGVNPCGRIFEEHAKQLKIIELNPKNYPTSELYAYRALFFGETIRNTPILIERSDGKRLTISLSAKPLYSENGEINAAVTIFDDVTEQVNTEKALKESESRLNMAQQIANLGNWEYYVNEDKALWSEELFRIFGLAPQPFGPTLDEYIQKVHPDDREAMNQQMENMLFQSQNLAKGSFDYRIIRKDGSIRTIHTERMVKEFDSSCKPSIIMGVEQDITERKQIEEKIAEYAKNLEKLVEERTNQLKAAERLAAIGQTAGMIGHDIRNPLQTIAGELFLMKQEIDFSPDSECKKDVQESLDSIQEQVDYINKIISDLQDFSRPIKPELVNVNLCTTIPKLLQTVPMPSNIEAIAICSKELPVIKLDLTLLKRILVNLVTNAIQAMPKGGKITIRAFEEKNYAQIWVEDTGTGISDSIKPKLFQPLMTTKSKGQGFGLAVVKRLVEAQGGSISFDSQFGKGTKFLIRFPVKK